MGIQECCKCLHLHVVGGRILIPLFLCVHASCKFYRVVLKSRKFRENNGIHKVRGVIVHGGVCKCLSVFRQFSCSKVIACLVERDNVSIF